MARYIDAEKLLKKLCDDDPSRMEDFYYNAILEAPTADVEEVKHGYFIRNERNIPKMKVFHEKGYASSMNNKSIGKGSD